MDGATVELWAGAGCTGVLTTTFIPYGVCTSSASGWKSIRVDYISEGPVVAAYVETCAQFEFRADPGICFTAGDGENWRAVVVGALQDLD